MTSAQERWKEDGCPKIQLGGLKIELPLHLLSPIAIGGAAAGIVSTLVCHPLEVLKVHHTCLRINSLKLFLDAEARGFNLHFGRKK
jgi:solute carrier family 25 phosphate transporter 23/24/25/41